MIRELASYERLADQVVGDEERLEQTMFELGAAEALIAEVGRARSGTRSPFTTFSTFLCAQAAIVRGHLRPPAMARGRDRRGAVRGRRRGRRRAPLRAAGLGSSTGTSRRSASTRASAPPDERLADDAPRRGAAAEGRRGGTAYFFTLTFSQRVGFGSILSITATSCSPVRVRSGCRGRARRQGSGRLPRRLRSCRRGSSAECRRRWPSGRRSGRRRRHHR